MKLSLTYLKQRHSFWIQEIGKSGIWNPGLFKPVEIVIRKHHRRFNALFSRRKFLKGGVVTKIVDKIIIYNKLDDFPTEYLDSLLVHEMIHQYLVQNGLDGKNPHGLPFKEMMNKINAAFPDSLNIEIKSQNPVVDPDGEGPVVYDLLFVISRDKSFCCVIHPSRIEKFHRMAQKLKSKKQIDSFQWGRSNNRFFSNVTRCTKVLHGITGPLSQAGDYCMRYGVVLNP